MTGRWRTWVVLIDGQTDDADDDDDDINLLVRAEQINLHFSVHSVNRYGLSLPRTVSGPPFKFAFSRLQEQLQQATSRKQQIPQTLPIS